MTTPFKDIEDRFWTWLNAELSANASYLTLKRFKSHEGRGLPFLDGPGPFTDPALVPAIFLSFERPNAEVNGDNTVLDSLYYRFGVAWKADAADPKRDAFEALVVAIRNAILEDLTSDETAISISEMTDERITAVTPPRQFAPVIGYLWTASLRLGYQPHHLP